MTTADPTPAKPEFRLSPDGTRIAQQWNAEVVWSWSWVTVKGKLLSGVARAGDVADWLPLVPAPATVDRDAAVELARSAVDWTGLVRVTLPEPGKQVWEFRAHEVTRRVVDALAAAGYLTAPAPVSEPQELRAEDWQVLGEAAHAARAALQPPSDEELVERVAEALAAAYNTKHATSRKDVSTPAEWLDEAHAAITTMQEVPRG